MNLHLDEWSKVSMINRFQANLRFLLREQNKKYKKESYQFLCKRITEYPEFKGDVYFDPFELRKF